MVASAVAPKLERLLAYLGQDFDGYPFDAAKDPKYFDRLLIEFVDLDIDEELKQYHAWILDQPGHKKIYYRSRFRTWLKTARQFRQSAAERQQPSWVRRWHAASRY